MRGTILRNRYEVFEAIGDGGMARVYRAHDRQLDRLVAIKVLHPELARRPEVMRRFDREARVAAGLSHPHIVAIHDVGRDEEMQYLVMEYVGGGSLRGLLARDSTLPPTMVLAIMEQLGSALDVAHARGVVHRDIKPENVLLTREGHVKVGDFGIAQALVDGGQTATGMVFGSVAYMSPEQALGEPVTGAADIYSAGALLYELLVGRPPFIAETALATAMQHVTREPELPSARKVGLPAGVDAVVLRALAKDPARRYQSGSELTAAFAAAMETSAPAPTAAEGPHAPQAIAAPMTRPDPVGAGTFPRERAPRRAAGVALLALTGIAGVAAVMGGNRLAAGGAGVTPSGTATMTPPPAAIRQRARAVYVRPTRPTIAPTATTVAAATPTPTLRAMATTPLSTSIPTYTPTPRAVPTRTPPPTAIAPSHPAPPQIGTTITITM